MSQINHKGPGKAPPNTHFDALNPRKVGQTYGERKAFQERADAKPTPPSFFGRIKDAFFGGKILNRIENFLNPTDRYLGTNTRTETGQIVNLHKKMEAGTTYKTSRPDNSKYIRFLDSAITFLDQKPKKRQV